MDKFNGKIWNSKVFEKYLKTVPSTKENSMIQSSIFKRVSKYGAKLSEQAGGNYIVEPIKGRIGGDELNYDGATNITSTSRGTFYQGKVAIGRAKAWGEDDFTEEITGTSFMAEAGEIREYWDERKQELVLAVLKGIFGMTGSNDFAANHTYRISGDLTADACNRAAQKALGDKKKNLKVMFMHSAVSTNLEGLQLLNFLKYTDKDGIERDLTLATYNGKLVIVDDEMPSEVGYELTTDTALNPAKTYYTKSGSKYTVVAAPSVDNIRTYYEQYTEYTTYMMGEGFFEYEDLRVKVPSELARDAKENGGHTDIISRIRFVIVPTLISYTKASQATLSPTNAELANGSNWELANDDASDKKYVDGKLIPLVRIISRG